MHRNEVTNDQQATDEEYDKCAADDAESIDSDVAGFPETTASDDMTLGEFLAQHPAPDTNRVERVEEEVTHEAAEEVEAVALSVESLALRLGCTARMVEDLSEFLATADESIARASEAASEAAAHAAAKTRDQATKAKEIAKSNFLLAWATVSDLASEVFRNLADESAELEDTAESIAERADAVATQAAATAASTDGAVVVSAHEGKKRRHKRRNKP